MSRELVMELRIHVDGNMRFLPRAEVVEVERSLVGKIYDICGEYRGKYKKRKQMNLPYFYCYGIIGVIFRKEVEWSERTTLFHVALYTDNHVYFRCKQCSVGSRLGRLNSKIKKAIYQYFSEKKEAEKWKYIRVKEQ